jgi:hypothetical protein
MLLDATFTVGFEHCIEIVYLCIFRLEIFPHFEDCFLKLHNLVFVPTILDLYALILLPWRNRQGLELSDPTRTGLVLIFDLVIFSFEFVVGESHLVDLRFFHQYLLLMAIGLLVLDGGGIRGFVFIIFLGNFKFSLIILS